MLPPTEKKQSLKLSPEEWCRRGDAAAAKIGRRDIHWVVRNGIPTCEYRVPPKSNYR